MSNSPASSNASLRYDVAIIGAGFSGSMLAVHLAQSDKRPSVALIEQSRSYGPGLAYGAASAEHLLNVPAGKMSAFPELPDHFLNWATQNPEVTFSLGISSINPGSFLPRLVYGKYLKELIADASKKTDRLHLIDAEAIDIEPLPDGGSQIRFADGGSLQANDVVLAWGNFPPTAPRNTEEEPVTGFLHNPWSQGVRETLAKAEPILILGSGLTCLDLLATAKQIGRRGAVHVLSRHGRFPQKHKPAPAYKAFLKRDALPHTIRNLFRLVRREINKAAYEDINWRAVIDSLRPFTQDLWRGFDDAERRRFLRHVKSLWETIRHRAAPAMVAAKEYLDEHHQLIRHRGRLENIAKNDQGVSVTFRPYGSTESQTLHVQAVINATGPESDPQRIQSALLTNLISRGMVKPDALGLGIGITNEQDPLHTVGSLRKGTLWESTAVPELRVQAVELARLLLQKRTLQAEKPVSSNVLTPPFHHWLFEI